MKMTDEPKEWRCSLSDVLVGSIVWRGRGVYLATTHHHRSGDQNYDAFPTLARAKRWVREQFDAPAYRNIRWESERHRWTLLADEWDEFYTEEIANG